MPRPKSATRASIIESALTLFWRHGFAGSSMDDLVRATGASRQTIYSEFGSKDGLFKEILSAYSETIVTPAFSPVESPGAGLAEIGSYWEFQIKRGEQAGLPGSGCLIANTMTERAPHVPEIAQMVVAHHDRLRAGFRNALRGTGIAARHRSTRKSVEAMATALAVFSNGLWDVSRVVSDARPLRLAAQAMIANLSDEEGQ